MCEKEKERNRSPLGIIRSSSRTAGEAASSGDRSGAYAVYMRERGPRSAEVQLGENEDIIKSREPGEEPKCTSRRKSSTIPDRAYTTKTGSLERKEENTASCAGPAKAGKKLGEECIDKIN